jgi:hypothetical protein
MLEKFHSTFESEEEEEEEITKKHMVGSYRWLV